MKFNILLVLLLIIGIQSTTAQTQFSKEEFNSLVCSRWKLTEISLNGKKFPTSELGENIIHYSSDGTFSVSEQGESYPGKWAFDSGTQELLTDDRDGKERHKVIQLTQTDMITETNDANGRFRMKFKKL